MKEPKQWYPDSEPSLLFFSIPQKAILIKYMLHAKHRRIDSAQNEKLDSVLGLEFDETCERARPFIAN
jgi:hypothetical protein